MMTKKEECFKAVGQFWSNNTECLKQVMDMTLYEDSGLKYEAILQLSLFILWPDRSEKILTLI